MSADLRKPLLYPPVGELSIVVSQIIEIHDQSNFIVIEHPLHPLSIRVDSSVILSRSARSHASAEDRQPLTMGSRNSTNRRARSFIRSSPE